MHNDKDFDVIVIGGSYSGLAAGLALGRALRDVLIIDSGQPCNRSTPRSHNFLTQDGTSPSEIASIARDQLRRYDNVNFFDGLAADAVITKTGFEVTVTTGEHFTAKRLILATGIKDMMPPIKGFAECWGISVLHCPYCHGYEVRYQPTGIIGNGEYGFEFSALISNWTDNLTLFTNGPSTTTSKQSEILHSRNIRIVEKEIAALQHLNGHLQAVIFKDGSMSAISSVYARAEFHLHSGIPEKLGCDLTESGHLKVDPMQKTSIGGVFACGDNASPMRTVANAVATGTTAGMMVNKELVLEKFTRDV
jgi:thioredoxin reductase